MIVNQQSAIYNLELDMASWPSGKARVCKTLIRGPNPLDASTDKGTINEEAANLSASSLFNSDKLSFACLQHSQMRKRNIAALQCFTVEANAFLLNQSSRFALTGRQLGPQ